MSAGPAIPGHVVVTARALHSLVRAAAADRLGVPARRVTARLGDSGGAIALDVLGPVRAGSDLVTVGATIAAQLREDVTALTGRRVGATRLEVTGIVHPDGRGRRVS